MTLVELKSEILNNTLQNDFLILKVADDNGRFIARQYAEEIAKNGCKTLREVEALESISTSALSAVFGSIDELKVLTVDTFEEAHNDFAIFTDNIVICKKIDKKIATDAEQFIVEIPALIDWQVEEYVSTICPELDQNQIHWLCAMCNNEVYRIKNELDKILLFEPEEREAIFEEIKADNNSDLYTKTAFEIIDYVSKKDIGKLAEIFSFSRVFDFEAEIPKTSKVQIPNKLNPVGFSTLMLQKYRQILFLSQKSGVSAEMLGMSKGAAYYARQDASFHTEDELRAGIKFLSGIDTKLKENLLDLSNEQKFAYIVCNMLTLQE